MELHAGEADDALLVDVPLLVAQQAPARRGHGLQERVERSRAAPLQIVLVLLDQFPETTCVAGFHALDSRVVAARHLFHLVLVRSGLDGIAIAAPYVGHVDSEHPQQTIAFARGEIAEGAEDPPDVVVLLRKASAVRSEEHTSEL